VPYNGSSADTIADTISSSKFYGDNYLTCDTFGYSTIYDAKKVLSGLAGAGAGATLFDTWKAAESALEKKAYLYGKLKHACMDSAMFKDATVGAAGVLIKMGTLPTQPCLRTGAFE
jgi:hypothetical protein